jgi:hypothetical protein
VRNRKNRIKKLKEKVKRGVLLIERTEEHEA